MSFTWRRSEPDEDGIGYEISEGYDTGGNTVYCLWETNTTNDNSELIGKWTKPDEYDWLDIESTWLSLVPGDNVQIAVTPPKTILEEARDLVYGDRNAQYGHPKDDYAKVATMWSAFLGVEISPHQAASMMIFIKMSRLAHEPKRDTIVDIAGYAEVVARILDMDE